MKRRIALLAIAILYQASPVVAAENWPQFRGPEARGVSDTKGLPDTWSATENVLWQRDVPGRGWSSPVVWGDRLFLTTVVDIGESEEAKKGLYFGGDRPEPPPGVHQWKVLCFALDSGEPLWEKLVHEGMPPTSRHLKNSYASETPVTDGEHLYVYFGSLGLFCFTLDGQQVWSQEFDPHKMRNDWGTAASPVLHEDRLYIINDNDEQSFLVAIDKNTGVEIWRTEREEASNWSTPYVWTNSLRTEIITPGSGKARAYDTKGNELYAFGGLSSITAGTPYAVGDLLYVSSGYVGDPKKPLFAIRPGATGDISLAEDQTDGEYIAWCQKTAAPYIPTTIVYRGLLYVLLDRGFVTCYDAQTGEQVYDKKRLPEGRAFTSSPWAYDGKIFCINEYGTTFVIRAGREYELLHTNKLAEGDMCMATPAVAGDKLLLRTTQRIYCIGEAAKNL